MRSGSRRRAASGECPACVRRYEAIIDCAGVGGAAAGARRWRYARYVTLTTPLLRETDARGVCAGGAAAALELVAQWAGAVRGAAGPERPQVRWAYFMPCAGDIELVRRLAERGQVSVCARACPCVRACVRARARVYERSGRCCSSRWEWSARSRGGRRRTRSRDWGRARRAGSSCWTSRASLPPRPPQPLHRLRRLHRPNPLHEDTPHCSEQ